MKLFGYPFVLVSTYVQQQRRKYGEKIQDSYKVNHIAGNHALSPCGPMGKFEPLQCHHLCAWIWYGIRQHFNAVEWMNVLHVCTRCVLSMIGALALRRHLVKILWMYIWDIVEEGWWIKLWGFGLYQFLRYSLWLESDYGCGMDVDRSQEESVLLDHREFLGEHL